MKHNSEQLASSSVETIDNNQENEAAPINQTDQEITSLIKTSLEKQSLLENLPEGWQTADDIATKQLEGKVSKTTVTKIANKLGLEGKKFRGGSSRVATFYSPEDVETIINHETVQKLLSRENSPEGWQTADNIATKQLEGKVSGSTVTRIANKLGLEGKKFRGGSGKAATFYSPEDVETIINHETVQKLLSRENHPEGWQTADDIATKQLEGEVSVATIVKIANKLGLEGKEFRGSSGKVVIFYSPEDVETIINHETVQKLLSRENPPECWQTADDIATKQLEGKVSQSTVTDIANKLGLEGKEFRGSSGKVVIFYSPEDVETIINHETVQKLLSRENPPECWQTADDIATKQLEGKVSKTTVTKIANKLGLEGKEFRGGNKRPTIFYSPEDVETIINHETIQKLLSLENSPEGWQTADDIATKQLEGKVSKTTVTDIANKLGLEGKEFRGGNKRPTIFYSPEEQDKIINHETIQKLLSLENPPEGWQTADYIATKQLEGKVYGSTVTKIANKLGLEGKEFKGSSGRSATFYSPEEQDEIIEKAEKSTFRTSFPEQAIAFYLQQAGISILQDIRPNWMKNPDTNHNLEVDIFIPFDNPPPLGIGIEYDGVVWHKNPDYDAKKNALSRKEGVEIIHIREKGCPELPSLDNGPAIACINRQDNRSNSSLDECIEQVLSKYLGIHLSDGLVDVSRDQAAIFDFMEASEKIIQDTDNVAEEDLKDDTLQAA